MMTDISEGTNKHKRMPPSWAVLTAAAAFLFGQLLSGFHDHSETEYETSDDGVPVVECTLCLAVSKKSLDIAPEPKVRSSVLAYSEYLFFPSVLPKVMALAAEHPTRAPPTLF
ncbi:MAG: hypothetical protein AB3N28_06385 [Kordiimonas sp.]